MFALFKTILVTFIVILPLFSQAGYSRKNPLKRRVASIFISKTFINEQLKARTAKGEIYKDFQIELDDKTDQMYLLGKVQVPIDDIGTKNLEPGVGEFKFRVTMKLSVTKDGHLMLEFPLKETYFYPANSRGGQKDRVIVPVELVSLGLASARGYLAALSGDLSIYDHKTKKLKAERADLNREMSKQKDPDKIEDLKLQLQLLDLRMKAVPLERQRMQNTAKSVTNILAFTGERDMKLNEEIVAQRNAITVKIRLSQLLPYLKDAELGGVRITHDKTDGGGEDYFIVDVDSQLDEIPTAKPRGKPAARVPLKVAPALLIRLNQNIFTSNAVVAIQKEKLTSVRDFDLSMENDGVHISGKWHKFFLNIPFEATIDFVTTDIDVFEVRLRELKIKGIDLKFLTKYALDAVKDRLDAALAGICTFEYLGEAKDESHVLKVTVNPKALVPAFPDLHLVAVDVDNRQLVLKIGHADAKPAAGSLDEMRMEKSHKR